MKHLGPIVLVACCVFVAVSGSDLPDPRRNDRGFDDRIVTETSAPAVA